MIVTLLYAALALGISNPAADLVRRPSETADAFMKRITQMEPMHKVLEVDFGNTSKGKKIIAFYPDEDGMCYGFLFFPLGNNRYTCDSLGSFTVCFPVGNDIQSVFTDDLENDGTRELFILNYGVCRNGWTDPETGEYLPGSNEEYHTHVYKQEGSTARRIDLGEHFDHIQTTAGVRAFLKSMRTSTIDFTRKNGETAADFMKRITHRNPAHQVLEMDFGSEGKKIVAFYNDTNGKCEGFLFFPLGNNRYDCDSLGTMTICLPVGNDIQSVFTDDLEDDGTMELFILKQGTCRERHTVDENDTTDYSTRTGQEFFTEVYKQNGTGTTAIRMGTLFTGLKTAAEVKARLKRNKNLYKDK